MKITIKPRVRMLRATSETAHTRKTSVGNNNNGQRLACPHRTNDNKIPYRKKQKATAEVASSRRAQRRLENNRRKVELASSLIKMMRDKVSGSVDTELADVTKILGQTSIGSGELNQIRSKLVTVLNRVIDPSEALTTLIQKLKLHVDIRKISTQLIDAIETSGVQK